MWVGSCIPPPGGRRLRYKYFVSDGVDPTDDSFEWLGETTRSVPIDRYLDIPGRNLQLYESRMTQPIAFDKQFNLIWDYRFFCESLSVEHQKEACRL